MASGAPALFVLLVIASFQQGFGHSALGSGRRRIPPAQQLVVFSENWHGDQWEQW